MRPELSQALVDAYAAVFVRPDGDDREPGHLLIECGDDWHDHLDGMAREIEAWAAASEIVVYVWQAKEEFGALRVHWRSADEERLTSEQRDTLLGILQSAEKRSEHVCEGCGRPGQLSVDDGVVRTRCDAHQGQRLRAIGSLARQGHVEGEPGSASKRSSDVR